MFASYRQHVFFAFFSLLLLVAVFHQNLFEGKHFFATDITTQNLPDRTYFAEHLRNGQLPLWTQGIFCGYPLFAEGQSGVFYPFFLLFVLLKNANVAYDLFILLHYWIGAICFYVYLRVRLLNHWSAAFSALSLMFSAHFFSFHIYPNHLSALVWIPLYLALFDLYAVKASRRWIGWGSVVLTLQLLAGHPQFACMGILLGFLLSFRVLKRYIRFVSLTGLVAFVVSAVQLIPHLEFLFHSQRAQGLALSEVTSLSIYPRLFMQLIFPRYFGTLNDQTFWAPGATPEEDLLLYVGFALIVAVAGIIRHWKESLPQIGLIAIGVLLALGKYVPLLQDVYLVRPFSFFRYPGRFSYFIVFGILVIAAQELDSLLASYNPARARLMALLCICLGVTSELICGMPIPPVASLSEPAQLKLHLAPMERFISLFDPLVPDRMADQLRPLSKKYELFREIYGGDQNLPSGYWHSRGIYHSLVPAGYFDRFSSGEYSADDPEFLSFTNTAVLVSPQPHERPVWKFERKEGNAWIYRHEPPGAVYYTNPASPQEKAPCQILYVSEEALRFHCSCSQPGTVYVSMNYYPGWQFYVNGKESLAQMAHGFALSLAVPSGENDVELEYNPISFQMGVFLSFVGLFLLLRLLFHP